MDGPLAEWGVVEQQQQKKHSSESQRRPNWLQWSFWYTQRVLGPIYQQITLLKPHFLFARSEFFKSEIQNVWFVENQFKNSFLVNKK